MFKLNLDFNPAQKEMRQVFVLEITASELVVLIVSIEKKVLLIGSECVDQQS